MPPRIPPPGQGPESFGEATVTSIALGARGGVAGLVVDIVRGPDTGQRLTLAARPMLVGSGPGCDLRVTDRTVSRRHLELHAQLGQAVVRDVGSHNGTFVRGVRLIEAVVPTGTEITLGDSTLVVRRAESADPTPEVSPDDHFGRLFGASLAMRQLYPLLARLANTDVTVLVEGETGTGKEVVAEALHEQSPRRDGPFVVFDCSSVPANLMEAELFGHERGAFTGAVGTRKGLFELAQGGTLFIDELGELDPMLQPKLLRAIERPEVRRVGGSQVIRTDVRIVAATRRDLDHEVQTGRFRDDLFHRFAVARVLLPPLRLRDGDVPLLARKFLHEIAPTAPDFPTEVMARLEDSQWAGNVRELRNTVVRYAALGSLGPLQQRAPGAGATQGATAGGDAIAEILRRGLPYPMARDAVLEAFNERYVSEMLQRHGGNVSRAAEAAGIARRYFQQLKARTR